MNIRVDLVYPISDGSPVTFKSPCDCSEVTGLIVYSPESVGSTNIIATEFIFADAHKNDVSEMAELFTEGVIVKLILDVTHNIAYVQNADTNAYLEGKFEETREFTVEKIAESKKYVDDRVTESIEYVDRQITLVNASGIPKLGIYFFQETATEDGQTVFPIGLGSFDIDTDTVLVDSGRTKLSHVSDYVVNADKTITLTEGVPAGRTIDITIMKHIPMGEEGEVNGVIMAKQSIPLDRLIGNVSVEGHTHDDRYYTKTEIDTNKADKTHTHSAGDIQAGTFAGKVVANVSATANLDQSQVRNIQASSTDITAGSTTLSSGHMYLTHE